MEGAETLQVVLAVFGELRAGWQPFGFEDRWPVEEHFFFWQYIKPFNEVKGTYRNIVHLAVLVIS